MDAETIKAICARITKPTVDSLGDNPERAVAILPPDFTIADVSHFLPPPNRIVQRVELLTVESFCAYVNAFRRPQTTIFADERTGSYEAVIDYHAEEAVCHDPQLERRGECDHLAGYACPKSLQWQTWVGSNGKSMTQTEFALFLETNLRDIIEPAAADLLQVAVNLQVHKAAQFSSEIRLDNGQTQFRYEETISGSSKVGKLDVPSQFVIQVPVFLGGRVFQIQARFRYRLNDSKLSFSYDLVRPQETFQAAVSIVTKEIIKDCLDVNVFEGARR